MRIKTTPKTIEKNTDSVVCRPAKHIRPTHSQEKKRVSIKNSEIPSEAKTKKKTKCISDIKLTEDEYKVYGDRFPMNYVKIRLLGKGGCALVWLGNKIDSSNNITSQVAIKQFARNSSYKSSSDVESCWAEVSIGRMIFEKDGKVKENCRKIGGADSIAALLDCIQEKHDLWAIYEVGGCSLAKLLFNVKGEFYQGERIYRIEHLPFYQKIKANPYFLKIILHRMLEALLLLSNLSIIHADMKSDNILIEYSEDKITSAKLIDFGSAFIYNKECRMRMSTPEYLAPECLEYLEMATAGTTKKNFSEIINPWSVDMWGLGAIFLEILTGFPLWMSLKGRVITPEGKQIISYGVFAIQGKSSIKIAHKQREVVSKIEEVLYKYNSFMRDPVGMDLLQAMLCLNPRMRISPQEALQHEYFNGIE